jgi:putative DNA primase/helicase
VDLRTGELRPSQPAERITKITAVEPTPTANCPLWLKFLEEATGGDRELVRFLQQWCGYCLTGTTREHALVFVYGPGGNGKSVFINVLTAILGGYSATAAMDTFTASHGDKHPTDLAMLRGARLVTASETEEGRAWAESRIKQMTGGDPVTARFMRQDFFTYMPSFKLTIIGNHKPVLRNVDEAARRRFNIVPLTIKPLHPDRELEQKLKGEWSGILRWMIDGCLDWQRHGLVRPASVIEATQTYFSDQDLFGQWLEDKCDLDPGNLHKFETSADLYASWSKYATAAGDKPGGQKSFSESLRRRGIAMHRTKHARTYRGVSLRRDEPWDG